MAIATYITASVILALIAAYLATVTIRAIRLLRERNSAPRTIWTWVKDVLDVVFSVP